MEIICEKIDFHINGKTAVAVGKFDGIHFGHMELLSHILRQKKQGRKAAVFTFYPSATVFFGNKEEKELTTRQEKRDLFAKMGVDVLVEFPLNDTTAGILPEEFVKEILLERMNAAYICAGTDVSFGKGGKGDRELLCHMGEQYGFSVEIIKKVFDGERELSSTYVREEVEKGNMEKAARLLGRAYSFSGTVENGNHLGRTIGFPTVNIYPEKEKLLPPRGVYISRVHMKEGIFFGVTNVGSKPTVQEQDRISIETYVFDFSETVYGQQICVELLSFRRKECKFPDVNALQQQLRKDIEDGRTYLVGNDLQI